GTKSSGANSQEWHRKGCSDCRAERKPALHIDTGSSRNLISDLIGSKSSAEGSISSEAPVPPQEAVFVANGSQSKQ
ncbi:hypothetical protein AVEN_13892-1, partial [Araneus ventricosus]